MPRVSIIIPLYDEENNLQELYQRLKKVLDPLTLEDYEIILIDDGSSDGTWPIIQKFSETDPKVKGIKLSRNFGHQSALIAGMDHAEGDVLITMDGDLQHPPELIPQFLAKWQEGFDIVCAQRERTENISWIKNFFSKFFLFAFNKISFVRLKEGVADFRLISREVVGVLKTMKERCRFLRGLVSWVGFRSAYIVYTAPKRLSGKAKYSLRKSLFLALTGILSFSPQPLYWAGFLGLVVTFFSFIYIIYAIYLKLFTHSSLSGWASILISVLFLGGVQLITIGILGSYLAMVFEEVKGRPIYIVQKITYKNSKNWKEEVNG
ncbi:MAG: glycosyltransferase family 2 protein [Candidatus Omnitrophica bacterium]|nr:glycosyltransferase family 2 protein [Candidatus Omnitrophota bacterium]